MAGLRHLCAGDAPPSPHFRAVSQRIPRGFLPGVQWQPIERALPVLLPTSALPASALPKCGLRLVRSARELPASLLLISLEKWLDYAISAPETRLRRLTFARSRSAFRAASFPACNGSPSSEPCQCCCRLPPCQRVRCRSAACGWCEAHVNCPLLCF